MIHTMNKVWDNPLEMLRDVDRAIGKRFNFDTGDLTAQYPVDIHEDDDALTVEAELPGFAKDEVDVNIDQGVLTISAERKPTDRTDGGAKPGGTMHVHERKYLRVARKFTLPSSVDPTNVDARLADGVLTLKLKKREEVKPRKIQVQ
ncbi:MAG: Hsp20/alpha crystallin family protein [Phycisphaerales bacterium JB063]